MTQCLESEQIYDAAATNKDFPHLHECEDCLQAVISHRVLWKNGTQIGSKASGLRVNQSREAKIEDLNGFKLRRKKEDMTEKLSYLRKVCKKYK